MALFYSMRGSKSIIHFITFIGGFKWGNHFISPDEGSKGVIICVTLL